MVVRKQRKKVSLDLLMVLGLLY